MIVQGSDVVKAVWFPRLCVITARLCTVQGCAFCKATGSWSAGCGPDLLVRAPWYLWRRDALWTARQSSAFKRERTLDECVAWGRPGSAHRRDYV